MTIDVLLEVSAFTFLSLFLTLIIHEMTHVLVLKKLGYQLTGINFNPGPLLKISVHHLGDLDPKDRTKILLLPLPVTLAVVSLVATVAMIQGWIYSFYFWIAATVACFIMSGQDIAEWKK